MKSSHLKLILSLGFVLCLIPLQAQKAKFITLTPAEFKAQVEQTVNPFIIDVRSSVADFEAGHITGAVQMNWEDFQFISKLKQRCTESDPIFVYCKLGKTSKAAAKKIISNGFKNVYSLKGGILVWEKSFPLVTE